jgi:hypothetical protein
MKLRLGLAASFFALTSSFAASAFAQQPWIRDRRYGEGAGVRAGNLELHPGVAGEVGYDSNYFQRAGDADPPAPAEPIIDVYRLRLTPSLTLSTLGAQRRDPGTPAPSVNFSAGAYAALNLLIPADSEGDEDVDPQRANVAGGANFELDVLPAGPWGFDLYGDYQRTVEPNNGPVGDTAITTDSFDRDAFRGGAGITARPGGGLFDWRLGYEIQYHLFERDAFEGFNNARHYFKTRGRWRFFPRTALIYDGQYGLIRYSNPTSQPNGETIESRIGINGLITYHFALLAMGGWAASFFDDITGVTPPSNTPGGNGVIEVQNYDDFVAQAELKWFLMPQPTLEATNAPVGLSTIAGGYVRNFAPSYLGSFYRRDRGYLKFSYFIGGVAVIGLEGGYGVYSYPASQIIAPGPDNQEGEFSEGRIDAQLFGEYRFASSFGVNTTLTYTQAISDTQPYDENIEFSRFQAFVGVRWFM